MTTFARIGAQDFYVSGGSGTVLNLSLNSTPTPGNLIVATIMFYRGAGATTISSAVDGNSNPYSFLSPSGWSVDCGQCFGIYMAVAPSNVHRDLTVTFAHSMDAAEMTGTEVAVTGGPCALTYSNTDQTTVGGDNKVDTPLLTVANANSFCMGQVAYQSSIASVNSPWSQLGSSGFSCAAVYIEDRSSNVAIDMTGFSGDAYSTLGMVFGPAGGGGSSFVPRILS